MTTPADLHAAIVARIQARLELAQAADLTGRVNPPWFDVEVLAERLSRGGGGFGRADAVLIAANDPKWTIGVCTAALERLERHAPWQHYDVTASAAPEVVCSGCGMGELGDWRYLWPCAEVQAEAAAWGVEVGR